MSSRAADPLARALALACLLTCGLVVGCREMPQAPASAPPSHPPGWQADDPEELLTPTSGVVVVDRSGELSFEKCALHALDGDPATEWITPPRDLEQWMLLELPARTKITRVGASTGDGVLHATAIAKLRFEASLDGLSFTELGTVDIEPKKDGQLLEVAPQEARFIRVTTLGNHGDEVLTSVRTLHVKGVELEKPTSVNFAGRWDSSGQIFEFHQDGSAVYGVAPMSPPMVFYGAVEGRVARLSWSRGNETGIASFAVNPSSTELSGTWHWTDEQQRLYFGEAWYGDRTGGAPAFTTSISQIANAHLRKSGKFPLYGLVFHPDGELDAEASRSAIAFIGQALQTFPTYRVRLEVVECSSWEESKNLERGRKRAATLSAALERAGFPASRLLVEPVSQTNRLSLRSRDVYSRVDFSLAGN